MIETISRQHVTSQPERVSANTETISHRGQMAVGGNTKNKHNMKNSVIMPVSREMAAEELAANLDNVGRAEASMISMGRVPVDPIFVDLMGGKSEFEGGDGVALLISFGLLEAFAIHCVRLDRNEGALSVLVRWFPDDCRIEAGVYRFRATFTDTTQVENFRCEFDPGFPPECGGRLSTSRTVKQWRLMDRERLVGIRGAVISYMKIWRSGWKVDHAAPHTVVSYRLSPSQAFRKLLAEQWCNPTLSPANRFERMPAEFEEWRRFFAIAENLQRNLDMALQPEGADEY